MRDPCASFALRRSIATRGGVGCACSGGCMGRAAGPESGTSHLSEFATRDADLAGERMQAFYGSSARVERCVRQPDFSMRMQAARVGSLTLGKAEFSNWSLTRETRASVIVTLPLTGMLSCRRPGRELENRCLRHGAIARPFETYAAGVQKGIGIGLTLPVDGLVARAERLADREFGDSLLSRMDEQLDATTPVATALARAMKSSLSEAHNLDAAGFWRFAAASYEDLLANLAVACLFPELTDGIDRGAPDCGRATIRRAHEHIREHACEPIELSRLARDLGVSMRSLQENFRRSYGCSPRAYITERRLFAARQRLLAPEPGDTVTAIAYECGFGDVAHFALGYRAKFGELPSATLTEARRRLH